MLKIGYKASAEQFGPNELLKFSVLAEQLGFDSVFISDHFQPWRHTGGHAPFSFTWLGALGARTSRIVMGTSVLTPTFRYHPSIVAQGFGTLGTMFPGRVILGIGTGESLNNGTHEVDVCRWALGVDYPQRVTAAGGRYHFKDDWQFYDTLVTSFEYEDKVISWEGNSCQGMKYYGRDRGSIVMGTNGTVLVDRDGYEVYDLTGKKTSEFKVGSTTSSADLLGRDSMTDAHFANFITGIRKGEKLNAPVSDGNVAVTMLQLSNVAWEVQRALHLDPKSGTILGDPAAMKMWGREYEQGWAPHV